MTTYGYSPGNCFEYSFWCGIWDAFNDPMGVSRTRPHSRKCVRIFVLPDCQCILYGYALCGTDRPRYCKDYLGNYCDWLDMSYTAFDIPMGALVFSLLRRELNGQNFYIQFSERLLVPCRRFSLLLH